MQSGTVDLHQNNDTETTDSVALMLVNAHDIYMRGDFAGAYVTLELALAKARARGDTFNEASALAFLATYAQRSVNREQAAARGEEALIVAAQCANYRASAEASVALCVTYCEVGMIDEGIRMAEEARIFAMQSNDKRLLSYAHTRTADAFVTREVIYGVPCTNAMLSHYRIARRLAREVPQLDPLIAALYNYMLGLKRRFRHSLDANRLVSRRRMLIAAHLADIIMKLTEPDAAKAMRRFVQFNCAPVWCLAGRGDEGLPIFAEHESTCGAMGGLAAEVFESIYGMAEVAAGFKDKGKQRLERVLSAPMSLGTFFSNRILIRGLMVDLALKESAHADACRHLLAMESERRLEFNHQSVMRQPVDARLRQLRDGHKAAETDALTQLLNRRGFPEKIALAFDSARKQGRTLSLAMVDIDRFKEVNDQLGHLAGDQLLRQVASILKKHCHNNDLVGRYGGDEFVIAAPDLAKEGLRARCEMIRDEICAVTPKIFGVINPITISAGVSDSTEAADVIGLIHQADNRLYFAKQSGRNNVVS